ncbi:NAD-dependent dehydratase [Gluconobacter thailandicus]|nr:NAD-dependent dehydratase [Gluconobacter thailandicus]
MDDTPFVPMDIRKDRVKINEIVRIAGVRDGIRTFLFCPTMIYGESLGLPAKSNQLPKPYAQLRNIGAGAYIGTGVNRWSNVHILDRAGLYRLALKKALSASYFYAENGEASFAEIVTFISKAPGFEGKMQSWSAQDTIAELGSGLIL